MLLMNIVGLSCSSLSFVLLFTGALTDFWLVSFGSDLFHVGLWQNCSRNLCTKATETGFISATRGFIIFSTALLLLGMIFSCLAFFRDHIGGIPAYLVSAVLECLSAIFLLIGMSIYTSETSYKVLNSSFNYQWSFFLCWTANALLIISGTAHFLAHHSSPLPGYDSM